MLKVEDLTLAFYDRKKDGETVVRQVSFALEKGGIMGLVGESGSGKSMTALAVMGLLPDAARLLSGKIWFDGRNLLELPPGELEALRGCRLSMIFQEPLTALNPTMRVGKQVEEVLLLHTDMGRQEQREKVLEILEQVGLKNPKRVYNAYPHQLSGGMRQRVMIAMAVVLEPDLLIADEPTTALDVTTEKQILELLARISREKNMSILLITHDLKLAKRYCHRVAVMEKGRIVEQGDAGVIFENPSHDYTKKLVSAVLVKNRRRREEIRKMAASVPEREMM